MLISIVTIGDEILFGQTIDTNSAWLGQELNKTGIKVAKIISAPDEERQIIEALNYAARQSGIILITGGLGPTKDDITKNTLCKYFNAKLVFDEMVLENIKTFFEKRGRELTERNRQQAEVIEGSIILKNSKGTAPGTWFEKEKKIFVSMPGVPYEMKAMFQIEVLPLLKKKFTFPSILHKIFLTAGIRESFLADKLIDFEDQLPENIKLAYLPSLGIVKLRLSAIGKNKKVLQDQIQQQAEILEPIIEKYLFGYDNESLEENIGKILRAKKQTIGTAESCTGGLIAHKLTSVSGSSDYYKGSIISYSNEIKMSELKVKKETLEKYGAVSEQTVREMAKGALEKLETDYMVVTSGIAGPLGGSDEKPVGTIWIAVGKKDMLDVKEYKLDMGNREQNIELFTVTALYQMWKFFSTKKDTRGHAPLY